VSIIVESLTDLIYLLSPRRPCESSETEQTDSSKKGREDSACELKSKEAVECTSERLEGKGNDILAMNVETNKGIPFWRECLYWYTMCSIFGLAVVFFAIVGVICEIEIETCLVWSRPVFILCWIAFIRVPEMKLTWYAATTAMWAWIALELFGYIMRHNQSFAISLTLISTTLLSFWD
jgi:hypothetical protein